MTSTGIMGISALIQDGSILLQIPVLPSAPNVNVIHIHQQNGNRNVNCVQMPNLRHNTLNINKPIQCISGSNLPIIPNLSMINPSISQYGSNHHPFKYSQHIPHTHTQNHTHSIPCTHSMMISPAHNINMHGTTMHDNTNYWIMSQRPQTQIQPMTNHPFQSHKEITSNISASKCTNISTITGHDYNRLETISSTTKNDCNVKTNTNGTVENIPNAIKTESIYKCTVCDKAFKRKTNLNSHAVCIHSFT